MLPLARWMLIVFAVGCITVTAGCPVVVVGGAAGAGAYAYSKGKLTRSYQADYDRTMAASLDTLKKLDMTVEEQPAGDAITSVVKAKGSNGAPVTVVVTLVAPNITEVTVRSGTVGLWDKKTSKQVHANIAQRLQ